MSGWGCPHEVNGQCQHVQGRCCDPGMKGCILAGRFYFSNEAKNRPPQPTMRQEHGSKREERGKR